MTESIVAHPEWLDAIGMVASSIAFAIAVYLQFYLKQKVRARNVLGFVGIGFGLFFLSARAGFVANETLLLLRAFGYLVFIILEILGIREVLKEIDSNKDTS